MTRTRGGWDRLEVATVMAVGVLTWGAEPTHAASADSVSNPTDAVIQGDADANGSGAIRLQTGTTDKMVVTNAGNVGIGTASPGAKLHVEKGSAGQIALFKGNGGLIGIAQGQVGGPHTMELTTADTAGNQATRVLLRGAGDTADIEFYRGARGAETLSMITKGDSGNVGIGTASPGNRLSVGTFVANGRLDVGQISGGATGGAQLSGFGSNGTPPEIGTVQFLLTDGTVGSESGDIAFRTKASASAVAERVRITSAGNVGIGTASPAAKLDVVGTVRASGLMLQSGAAAGSVLTSDATGRATWQPPSPLNGNSAINSYGLADAPPPGTSGHLARLTDSIQGVWIDTGTQWVSLSGEVINAKEFGAKGDGIADDTVPIQAALDAAVTSRRNVMLPAGTYRVTNALTNAGLQTSLLGAGPATTIIDIPATFNQKASGVIVLTGGEAPRLVSGLTIRFEQPDTAARSSLIPYPPALSCVAQGRVRVEHVRIERAWNGIDMKGNSGGVVLGDIELSAFNVGVDIDGALDSVRISDVHIWPFGLTPNQQRVFAEAETIGIRSGRADDLHIHNLLTISGTGIRFYESSSGRTFGQVTNSDFDTRTGIVLEQGIISVNGSFFSQLDPSSGIKQTGGSLRVTGCRFEGTSLAPVIAIANTSPAAIDTVLVGNTFETFSTDRASVKAEASVTGGGPIALAVTGNMFNRDPDTSYAIPTIDISGTVRSAITGNLTRDKGRGPGDFVRFATNTWAQVAQNILLAWGVKLPAAHSYISVGSNSAPVFTGANP